MRRRIARMILFAVAIPVAAWALGALADQVEQRRGPDSKAAKGLRVTRKVIRSGA